MLPFGLVIVGFAISFSVSWALAAPTDLPSDQQATGAEAKSSVWERLSADWQVVVHGEGGSKSDAHGGNADTAIALWTNNPHPTPTAALDLLAQDASLSSPAASTSAASASSAEQDGQLQRFGRFIGRWGAELASWLYNWQKMLEEWLENRVGGVAGKVAVQLLRFLLVLALGAFYFFYIGDIQEMARGGDAGDFGGGEGYNERNKELGEVVANAKTFVDCWCKIYSLAPSL